MLLSLCRNPLISIHAPAKGATCEVLKPHRLNRFQSTLPRRERLLQEQHLLRISYFNPRSREGSDGVLTTTFKMTKISIHAPAKGATLIHEEEEKILDNFNPRSREGSDMGKSANQSVGK